MSETESDWPFERRPFSAERMLAELDLPVADWRPRHAELREHFVAAVEPLGRLLCEARGPISSEQPFAILQNTCRALSDLIAGFHLVLHAYLNQAYSVLRPVLDSADLIELFAKDSAEAELWVKTEEGHRHFAPGAVRTRLGKDRHDPVHSLLSELGSHPRFAGARLTGYIAVRIGPGEEEEKPVANLRIGPFNADDPATMHAALFALLGTCLVGLRMSHLIGLVPGVTEAKYVDALHDMGHGLDRAAKTIKSELDEASSEGTEFLETILQYLIEQAALWAKEIEAAAA